MRQSFTCLVIVPIDLAYTPLVFTAHTAALRYGKPFGYGILPGDYPLHHADQDLDMLPHSVSHGYIAQVGCMLTRSHPWDPIA